jgi:hypothetical protein
MNIRPFPEKLLLSSAAEYLETGEAITEILL